MLKCCKTCKLTLKYSFGNKCLFFTPFIYQLIQFLDHLMETVEWKCGIDSCVLILTSQFFELAKHCLALSNHEHLPKIIQHKCVLQQYQNQYLLRLLKETTSFILQKYWMAHPLPDMTLCYFSTQLIT